MDRVKFGRALGYGARHAARTVAQAVDAAATPAPNARQTPAASSNARPSTPPPQRSSSARRMPDPATVRAAGRQAKKSLVAPVVRFSSVVWLQVTGVFFALVATTMGLAAWRARAALHTAPSSHPFLKLCAYIAVCVLFTYFTVSSFVRASRR